MIRFGWRVQRFELATVLAIAIAVSAAAMVVIWRLNEIAPPADCLRGFFGAEGVVASGCPDVEPFLERASSEAENVMTMMLFLPFVFGALPASGLLAGEIEHRTAQLAWMLAPSRRRWLLERLIPVLLVSIGASIAIAIAAESLEHARAPWLDARASFEDYGQRGPLVVMRTLAFASVGLLVGTITGRQIPALVLSVGLSIVLLFAVTTFRPFGEPLEPVTVFNSAGGDLSVAARYRADDGSLLTYTEALARGPQGSSRDQATDWIAEHFEFTVIGVPGARMPDVELRETLVLGLVAVVAFGATFLLVERRRPY